VHLGFEPVVPLAAQVRPGALTAGDAPAAPAAFAAGRTPGDSQQVPSA
jgi:hypothetical protein